MKKLLVILMSGMVLLGGVKGVDVAANYFADEMIEDQEAKATEAIHEFVTNTNEADNGVEQCYYGIDTDGRYQLVIKYENGPEYTFHASSPIGIVHSVNKWLD